MFSVNVPVLRVTISSFIINAQYLGKKPINQCPTDLGYFLFMSETTSKEHSFGGKMIPIGPISVNKTVFKVMAFSSFLLILLI